MALEEALEILNQMGVEFNSINVLDNDKIREGIKKFSNWPTIPQLYVKEEFDNSPFKYVNRPQSQTGLYIKQNKNK